MRLEYSLAFEFGFQILAVTHIGRNNIPQRLQKRLLPCVQFPQEAQYIFFLPEVVETKVIY
jgi:hypothetical protein